MCQSSQTISIFIDRLFQWHKYLFAHRWASNFPTPIICKYRACLIKSGRVVPLFEICLTIWTNRKTNLQIKCRTSLKKARIFISGGKVSYKGSNRKVNFRSNQLNTVRKKRQVRSRPPNKLITSHRAHPFECVPRRSMPSLERLLACVAGQAPRLDLLSVDRRRAGAPHAPHGKQRKAPCFEKLLFTTRSRIQESAKKTDRTREHLKNKQIQIFNA